MPPRQRPFRVATAARRSHPIKAREGPAHLGVPPPFHSSGRPEQTISVWANLLGTACQSHAPRRNPGSPMSEICRRAEWMLIFTEVTGWVSEQTAKCICKPGPELNET
jgi:hypothetical protein